MEDYYNKVYLHPMPDTHNLTDKTDKELNTLLDPKYNFNILLAALIEKDRRRDAELIELQNRIRILEDKASKRPGRKRKTFYIDNHELTDDYLCHLIDNDYYTVRELERTVGAKKNVLRNRCNDYKRSVNNHGNSAISYAGMFYSLTIPFFTRSNQKLLAGSTF